MNKIIKVTGKGKLSVKPDLVRLMIDLKDVRKNYEETLEQSAAQVGILKDCIVKLGFDKSDLKTIRFNVDTKYEGYQDENHNWKNKFVGYEFMHSMKLEFDVDNRRLGQLLYALSHLDIHPELHMEYTIRDVEAAKKELLAKAVADSKEKAKVLSEAAGVALGDIVTIDYSWDEIAFKTVPMDRCVTLAQSAGGASNGCYDIDIEADDIKVSDTVTVVWEIKG